MTVSPPTIVRRRLHGEKLLQNSTEANNPSRPPTIRMIPTVVEVEPGGLDLQGKGQDRADNEQEDAEADAHRHASSDPAVVRSWLLSAGGALL